MEIIAANKFLMLDKESVGRVVASVRASDLVPRKRPTVALSNVMSPMQILELASVALCSAGFSIEEVTRFLGEAIAQTGDWGGFMSVINRWVNVVKK